MAAAVVVALAGDCAARAESAPAVPPLTVTVTSEEPALVLGIDDQTTLTIQVSGAELSAVSVPRLLCNVGRIDAVERTGPRTFTARFATPDERFPQIALVAAEIQHARRTVRGLATIRLEGATSVPLRTDPGAEVTLRVGSREFGPVVADRDGKVRVPVLVPPGSDTGTARSVDRYGLATETQVDLQLPPISRVLVVAPASIEVGTFAEVAVYAVETGGEPIRSRAIGLRSSGRRPAPLGGPLGEARFLVEAPERLSEGPLRLLAIAAGRPDARAELAVPLRPGPPRNLLLAPSRRQLVVGSKETLRVVISAEDAYGNATPAEGVEAAVDGELIPVDADLGGRMAVEVPAPDLYPGHDSLRVEATLEPARGETAIRLAGGPPARLAMDIDRSRVTGNGRSAAQVVVRVFDGGGTPTQGAWMSWRAEGGRLAPVSSPAEGVYVTQFIPELVVLDRRARVEVELGPELRASVGLTAEAPFSRIALTPRVGLFSNLGSLWGGAGFVQVESRTLRLRAPVTGGIEVGLVRDRASGVEGTTRSQVAIDQVPVLAVGRYHLPVARTIEVAGGLGGGVSVGRVRLETAGLAVRTVNLAPAVEASIEAAMAWGPGQLVSGLRYLWIDFGKVSAADSVRGNTVGLMIDVGYRFGY